MARIEPQGYLRSAVWATETLTSIGYGDFAPTSDAGKTFTIFYVLLGTFVFARFLALALWYPAHWRAANRLAARMATLSGGPGGTGGGAAAKAVHRARRATGLDGGLVADLAAVGRADYALHFLVALGKIDAADVADATDVYDALRGDAARRDERRDARGDRGDRGGGGTPPVTPPRSSDARGARGAQGETRGVEGKNPFHL